MAHLTPAQNERLRRAMIEYRDRECSGSVTELATRLKRKQPSISVILNRKSGASLATAQAFAGLVRREVLSLLGPATPTAGERDLLDHEPRQPSVTKTPRYASLQTVLEHPSNKDRWSPSAVAALQSMQLDADQDPGERWFTETLDRIDAALKVSIPKLPDRGVEPISDLDDAPRRKSTKR